MNEARKEHKLIQSYVNDRFFVSTAYRRASTMEEVWYYETMAWPWNPKTRGTEGGFIVHADSGRGPARAMEHHFKICEALRVNGKYEEPD